MGLRGPVSAAPLAEPNLERQFGGGTDHALTIAKRQLKVEQEQRDQLKRVADRLERLDAIRWAL